MEFEEIEIRKRIEEAKKQKFCAEQRMCQADIKIGEYDLQLLELNNEKEIEIAKERPTTYRDYPESIINQAPIMIGIDKETYRIKTKKSLLKTTVWDLVKLQKLIPKTKEYPSTNDIAREMGWTNTKTAYTCCSIEYGFADTVLNNIPSFKFDDIAVNRSHSVY